MAAGVVVSHVSGFRLATDIAGRSVDGSATFSHTVSSSSAELKEPTNIGFDGGLGLELRLSRFRIAPEARYIRWKTKSFRTEFGNAFHSYRNQVEILLGLSF